MVPDDAGMDVVPLGLNYVLSQTEQRRVEPHSEALSREPPCGPDSVTLERPAGGAVVHGVVPYRTVVLFSHEGAVVMRDQQSRKRMRVKQLRYRDSALPTQTHPRPSGPPTRPHSRSSSTSAPVSAAPPPLPEQHRGLCPKLEPVIGQP